MNITNKIGGRSVNYIKMRAESPSSGSENLQSLTIFDDSVHTNRKWPITKKNRRCIKMEQNKGLDHFHLFVFANP